MAYVLLCFYDAISEGTHAMDIGILLVHRMTCGNIFRREWYNLFLSKISGQCKKRRDKGTLSHRNRKENNQCMFTKWIQNLCT